MIRKGKAKSTRGKIGVLCFIVCFCVLIQSVQASGFFGSAGVPVTNYSIVYPWHGQYITHCEPITPDVKAYVYKSLPINDTVPASNAYQKTDNKDKSFLVHEFIDEEETGRQFLRGYAYYTRRIGWREYKSRFKETLLFISADDWSCDFDRRTRKWVNYVRKYNRDREEGKK